MKLANLILAGSILVGSVGFALAQTPAPAGAMSGAGGGGRGAMRAACGGDITTLCAGKTGPDVRSCLADNKDKVSAACKAAMDAPRPAPAGQ